MAINATRQPVLNDKIRRIALFLTVVGAGIALVSSIGTTNRPAQAERSVLSNSAVPPETKKMPAHIGIPVRIQIADILIDVAIEPGAYDPATEDWSIGTSVAQYATETPPVNDGAGTTLIYGHNNPKVFMPLFSVKPSSLAVITTDDGQKFTYRYETQSDIAPTATQTVKNTYAPTIALLTCSGEDYSRRTVFQFSFVSWEAA